MSAETVIRAEARRRLAAAVERQGPGYANAAASIRSDTWGNVWTAAALEALTATARDPIELDAA